MGSESVFPDRSGRLLWRRFTTGKLKDAELRFDRADGTVAFRCKGRWKESQFSLPVGVDGVQRIVVLTSADARGAGKIRTSYLLMVDSGGKILSIPAVPAGFTTQYAWADDQQRLWWPEERLKEFAGSAGLEYERIEVSKKAIPRPMATAVAVTRDIDPWSEIQIVITLGFVSAGAVGIAVNTLSSIAALVCTLAIMVPTAAVSLTMWAGRVTGWIERPDRPESPPSSGAKNVKMW